MLRKCLNSKIIKDNLSLANISRNPIIFSLLHPFRSAVSTCACSDERLLKHLHKNYLCYGTPEKRYFSSTATARDRGGSSNAAYAAAQAAEESRQSQIVKLLEKKMEIRTRLLMEQVRVDLPA